MSRKEVSRPSWDDYFLGLACVVSARSMDAETKHGTLIVNPDRHIVGTGYNSFPRGMKDEELPNTRPQKYVWVTHSERNALANCSLRPKGCTAYVTGESCFECLKAMWQHGIIKVVHLARHGSLLITDEERQIRESFLLQTGLEVVSLQPDLSWLSLTPR